MPYFKLKTEIWTWEERVFCCFRSPKEVLIYMNRNSPIFVTRAQQHHLKELLLEDDFIKLTDFLFQNNLHVN